jgi:hypothetical protein
MRYESPYEKELGELIAPDNCRIESGEENENPFLKLFYKTSKGKEYLLVKENASWSLDYSYRICDRKWYNVRGNLHRDEKDGPALIRDGWRGISYHFYKNGKMHRESGPAIWDAHGLCVYELDGKELSKELWQTCVANGGKLPDKPKKVELKKLKEIAAQLGEQARQSGMINGYKIEEEELPQLDYASKVSSWKSHGTMDQPNCMIEYCLNCEPLDDTLRCYVLVDSSGNICNSYLQIE